MEWNCFCTCCVWRKLVKLETGKSACSDNLAADGKQICLLQHIRIVLSYKCWVIKGQKAETFCFSWGYCSTDLIPSLQFVLILTDVSKMLKSGFFWMHFLGMSRVPNQLLDCLQMLVLLPGFQLYLILYVSALTFLCISASPSGN